MLLRTWLVVGSAMVSLLLLPGSVALAGSLHIGSPHGGAGTPQAAAARAPAQAAAVAPGSATPSAGTPTAPGNPSGSAGPSGSTSPSGSSSTKRTSSGVIIGILILGAAVLLVRRMTGVRPARWRRPLPGQQPPPEE